MRFLTEALLALGVALTYAAPKSADETAIVSKGDTDALLSEFQSDDAMVTTCLKGLRCTLMTVGQAKGLPYDTIASIYNPKGQNEISLALSPTLLTMTKSLQSLEQQKEHLAALQASMDALSSASSKGQSVNAEVQQRYVQTMSKAAAYPYYAPGYKGAALAPVLVSKGAAPSKGAYVSTQYEYTKCPLTAYELGKAQKYGSEMKLQLESSNVVNARLMAEKSRLEASRASMEFLKDKAESRAAFNAKYAAEQKSQAEVLSNALTVCSAEKSILKVQKSDLETQLAATQKLFSMEKAENERLSQSLSDCNDAKNDLTIRLGTQTTRAENAEQELAETKARLEEEIRILRGELTDTKKDLEDEQNAHVATQKTLAETQEQLESTEAARQALEEAKNQLQDELAETKAQLEVTTLERDQLQTTLDATSAALAETTALKLQCESDLATQTAISDELKEQLEETVGLLESEKEAREELAATLEEVRETAQKVQEEVEKLQQENAELQGQVETLKDEQEKALAMAAGCPPTYEKFGSSCYKYVREKSHWTDAQLKCMKDGGNLVGIETEQEQLFLTNYLDRHGAVSAYAYTGGMRSAGEWKWVGEDSVMSPSDFWLTDESRMRDGYDCQALFTSDRARFGQWVGLPCYSSVPYVCEYQLLPAQAAVQNEAEQAAIIKMAEDAPQYLKAAVL